MADGPVGGEDGAAAGVELGVVLEDLGRGGDGVEGRPAGGDLGVARAERLLERAADGRLGRVRQVGPGDRPGAAVEHEDDGVAVEAGQHLRRLGGGGDRQQDEGREKNEGAEHGDGWTYVGDEDSRRPVLALLRRLRSPALVAVLAILAGPSASAACLHAMADAAHGGHAMPMGEAPRGHDEAPPCHETPEPGAPTPSDGHGLHDCTSPCCLAEAPVSDAPSVVVSAAQAVPAPLTVEIDVPAAPLVPAVDPAETPPPRTARLHAVFQRFLI